MIGVSNDATVGELPGDGAGQPWPKCLNDPVLVCRPCDPDLVAGPAAPQPGVEQLHHLAERSRARVAVRRTELRVAALVYMLDQIGERSMPCTVRIVSATRDFVVMHAVARRDHQNVVADGAPPSFDDAKARAHIDRAAVVEYAG
jgi:hypothetical protein